jgi:anti-sigma regulatory factor (Ser/Thr protein kinase)
MEEQLVLALPAGPGAASTARRAVSDRLSPPLGGQALDDVRLLVSELITNSLRHAGLRPGDRVLLRAGVESDQLRVEVHDPGRHGPPKPRTPGEHGGGYGLYLLEQIAQRWGIERDGGTLVWFELPAGRAG